MGLLAGDTYDPATAVNKSTASLLAMTALDTVNLRRTFTAPSNGAVLVHINGTVRGGSATPFWPSLLFGVMAGATVVRRHAPQGGPHSTVQAATSYWSFDSLFIVGGLTAGASYTWDAAYCVEVAATGSNLSYGGPNDATTNNAFGGFVYEVWTTA